MEEWASSNGALRQGFYLHSSDDYHTDVHAVASQPLPSGTTVLYVPEAMILTSAKAMAELRSNQMNQAEKIIQSVNAQDQLRHFYLMLKVLVEYEKGQDSPWYHWLNSLPRYYTNAASMTPFCYECLPSLMKKLAMEERRLLGKLSVRSVPFLSDDTVWNEELCTWAFQVVYTRSFESPDGDLKLVPLGDYFNHGSDYTEIATCYDDDGNYYATTTYDVEAGCPLRMSYGDPTNPSFLFARYGFVDESSLATFCKIFPPHVNADMEALGYAQNKMLFYKDTGDISQEVSVCLECFGVVVGLFGLLWFVCDCRFCCLSYGCPREKVWEQYLHRAFHTTIITAMVLRVCVASYRRRFSCCAGEKVSVYPTFDWHISCISKPTIITNIS